MGMTGNVGKRLVVAGLACLMVTTGLVPGGTPQAEALTIADRIETVDTSTTTGSWAPNAPGPSGIAYRPETNTLIVVDGDKNNEGAGLPNLWEYSLDTKTVVYSATINVTGDATGVSWDHDNSRLFVSSDSSAGVYVFGPGGDGRFSGDSTDFIDLAALAAPTPVDVEDPAYDASTGNLFVLSGNNGLIFEIDPMTGDFGDGDDVLVTPTGLPVPADPALNPDHPLDWEGLALDPGTGHLLVGTKEADDEVTGHFIYEITTAGAFFDRIDVAVIENELPTPANPPLVISGLTVQPGAGGIPTTYWIADRGEFSPATTNDGRLHRIHPGPVAVPDEPPVLDPIDNKSGNEGTLITFQATAVDDFGDELEFTLDPGFPTGASIHPVTGIFTWIPTEAQGRTAPHPVTVIVTDALGNPDSGLINITANEVNQAPVVTANPDLTRGQGEALSLQMFATDADLPAQAITWTATGLPSGVSISASGLISGTLPQGANVYNITVTAHDNGPGLLTGSDTFVLTVVDTNSSPVLAPIGNKSVAQGSLLAFTATATDADGDGLTFSLVTPPTGAAITAAGNFTWTPNVAPGNYPVTVKVTDNGTPVLSDQETIMVTVTAFDPNPDPDNPFVDDDGHIFENAIEWLAAEGITSGCNPPTNDRFCPDDHVTRGQMAAFLVRAKGYTAIADDFFVDDAGSVFENAINRLRTAGVTQGCNPPTNDRYCPDEVVTRGQMAAFLVRAFDLPSYNGPDRFTDDNGNVFEGAIERLAQAGITLGCNPPTNDRYCPDDFVTRGQMAAFLKRALGG
jgi:hypothetical protein